MARVSTVASEESPEPIRYGVRRKELRGCAKIAQCDSDYQRDPIYAHLALMISPRAIQRNLQARPAHSLLIGPLTL